EQDGHRRRRRGLERHVVRREHLAGIRDALAVEQPAHDLDALAQAAQRRLEGIDICSSIHFRLLLPRPRTTRPGAIPASAAVSMAMSAGWRVYGLTTPRPITMRSVTAAAAAASAYAPGPK